MDCLFQFFQVIKQTKRVSTSQTVVKLQQVILKPVYTIFNIWLKSSYITEAVWEEGESSSRSFDPLIIWSWNLHLRRHFKLGIWQTKNWFLMTSAKTETSVSFQLWCLKDHHIWNFTNGWPEMLSFPCQ